MINNIADSLCNCRFESTYTTTEESVYQNLLDIILTCIRCDAGVLLTKKRVWHLFETVYAMAFQKSVTPVPPIHPLSFSYSKNRLPARSLTLFSRFSPVCGTLRPSTA